MLGFRKNSKNFTLFVGILSHPPVNIVLLESMLQVRLNEKTVDPFKSEDSLIQGLKPMRAEFETKKSKLSGLQGQVENYEKGFLQETKSLDKDIMVIAEYSMRLLEKLDGYSIAEVTFFYFKK